MILFLIVTAILNIALGYALAVYLGKANAPTTWREMFATPPAIETTSFAAQFAMLQNDRSRAIDEVSSSTYATPQTAEQPAEDATHSTIMANQADDEPFAPAEVMEQELLAGIEEFRNQLSQLKGQGVAGILLDTMALDAAR